MASAPDPRRTVAAVLAVALTAALVWLGTGMHPWWPAVWFAPLPMLVYAAGASWWRAAIAAAIAWLVGMLSFWHYLHDVLRIPGAFVAQFYKPHGRDARRGERLQRRARRQARLPHRQRQQRPHPRRGIQ